MSKDDANPMSLRLWASIDLLHVVTGFVEKAALAFGLAQDGALALTLAAEEIFAYLCQEAGPGWPVEIRCLQGGYLVKVEFLLPVDRFNLRAFNLTAGISPEDETGLDELGLFIAARKVDRFQVAETASGTICLVLIKEKTYPGQEAVGFPACLPLETYRIRRPEPEQAKLMAALVKRDFPEALVPKAFAFAGKVVDMLAAGHFHAACAFGPAGQMGGAIIWQWSGPKTVEFFGPYLFGQPKDSPMAADLLDACINSIAKSPAVALICRMPTEFLPRRQFEILGELEISDRRGRAVTQPTFFRQMQEDTGCTVTCHGELAEFLNCQYRRLVLPRQVQVTAAAGEQQAQYSVLAADFDRDWNLATLHPIQAGADAKDNLIRHVELFRREGVANIFFELDLGATWQVGFGRVLPAAGFVPRLVLPYAGRSDLVVFQWQEAR